LKFCFFSLSGVQDKDEYAHTCFDPGFTLQDDDSDAKLHGSTENRVHFCAHLLEVPFTNAHVEQAEHRKQLKKDAHGRYLKRKRSQATTTLDTMGSIEACYFTFSATR